MNYFVTLGQEKKKLNTSARSDCDYLVGEAVRCVVEKLMCCCDGAAGVMPAQGSTSPLKTGALPSSNFVVMQFQEGCPRSRQI